MGRRRPWLSPDCLRNPKSDGSHFGFRKQWRRSGVRNLFAIPLNEIKFRIRIKHDTRAARRRNGTAPARNFFRNLARGEVIQLRGQRVVWGQKLSVTGACLMSGESLIILSPDASRVTAILGDDKRRWEIETLFKALKS